ncbi:MAG: class I SAM-dependent methyltransferase [Planctomycetaceae bacterium]|nr:class I SAM-dependent methyltransferase [Planctomycetaceae bacterium]
MLRLRDSPMLLDAAASAVGSEFQIQKQLRGRFDDDLVRAALTLNDLRRRAAGKFTRAAEMWFDRQGLEQATAEVVACYKARRFTGDVWDLCCGIGSDAGAMAARGPVTAVDRNPAACLRTMWNAELAGVGDRVAIECRDVGELDVSGRLVHIDPDRRPNALGRALRIEDYVPGLEALQTLTTQARGGAIKLSPACNFGGKFPQAEVELISLHGECKEATIWFGELVGTAPFRATALPSGETLSGHPLDTLAERSTLGAWIFDPDPSIVRAGLVDLLAETLGLRRLDDAEEYLTGDRYVRSAFVQAFEVLESLPNQEREIRHALRRSDFGPLEIKCRHIPIAAEELRRRLPRGGEQPGVLLFVREHGKARAVLARRFRSTEAQESRSLGFEEC